jgi:putative transcriptional regulator
MTKGKATRKTSPRAVSARAKVSRKAPKTANLGDALIEAMKEVVAHRKGKVALPSRIIHVPERVDVAAIRKAKGLSQSQFAKRYGFELRTLQDWEQGRREPERAARILLRVIEREPEAVERALRAA